MVDCSNRTNDPIQATALYKFQVILASDPLACTVFTVHSLPSLSVFFQMFQIRGSNAAPTNADVVRLLGYSAIWQLGSC